MGRCESPDMDVENKRGFFTRAVFTLNHGTVSPVSLQGFKIVFLTQIREMMALTVWNFVVLPRSQNWWSLFLRTFALCKLRPRDLTPGKSVCKDQNVDMITYLRPYLVNTKGLVNVIHYYCHFKVCSITTFSTWRAPILSWLCLWDLVFV